MRAHQGLGAHEEALPVRELPISLWIENTTKTDIPNDESDEDDEDEDDNANIEEVEGDDEKKEFKEEEEEEDRAGSHPRVEPDEQAEVPVDVQPTRSPRRNTPPSTSTSATTGRITSL